MIDIEHLKKELSDYSVNKINHINSSSTIDFSAVEIYKGDFEITITNLTSVCGGVILSNIELDYERNDLKRIITALKNQQIGYIQYVVAEDQECEDEIIEILEENNFLSLDIGYNPKTRNELTLYYLATND